MPLYYIIMKRFEVMTLLTRNLTISRNYSPIHAGVVLSQLAPIVFSVHVVRLLPNIVCPLIHENVHTELATLPFVHLTSPLIGARGIFDPQLAVTDTCLMRN